uniref:Uncharacterized protein n=1 Tax=Clastoptera arizonana TaxID=38151 RepID=A0A1B6E7K4_9HEMI
MSYNFINHAHKILNYLKRSRLTTISQHYVNFTLKLNCFFTPRMPESSKIPNICITKIVDVKKPIFYTEMAATLSTLHKNTTPNELWDTEKLIAEKIKESKSALKDGNVSKARSILEDTIKTYGHAEPIYVGMQCVYEMLATIAYQNRELGKAQALLITLVGKLSSSGVKYDDNTITAYTLKIARLYDEQKMDDFAELGYKLVGKKYLLHFCTHVCWSEMNATLTKSCYGTVLV